MTISQTITLLPVRHLPKAIAFYRQLGFIVEDQRDDWGWAMLAAGESRLMLDQSINHGAGEPRGAVVYLYVDDVAALQRTLFEAGIKVPFPEATFYGLTEFRLEDPDGNRLWIGQLPTQSPEDSQ